LIKIMSLRLIQQS